MSGVNNQCNQELIVDASQNDISMADGTVKGSLQRIIELYVDNLFEWLSLEDLKALRRTCKQMKQDVDCYIQRKSSKAVRKMYMNNDRLKRVLGQIESIKYIL